MVGRPILAAACFRAGSAAISRSRLKGGCSQNWPPYKEACLPFDAPRSLIPRDRSPPEVGFIRHVTRQRGVVAEHGILHHRRARLYRPEEIAQVQHAVILAVSFVNGAL